MNMLKRTLAMMLVLCMLFTMAPITAFAEDTTDSAGTVAPAADGDLGDNIPDADQPDADQPDADQPAANQPDANQPAANQPAANQPAANQPDADQPDANQPDANQPDANQPDANQPDANQPDADQPAANQPAANQPDANQPAANQPDADQPNTDVSSEAEIDVCDLDEISDVTAYSFADPIAITEFIRVYHLDCGRKYFTVDEVKEIIDLLSSEGYTHLELAFGNDGLRFLLDDMSIGSYSNSGVKSAIQNANIKYSHSGEWTQAEMDTIITYAASKNIEILPLMNTPGHMNAILNALNSLTGQTLNYNYDPRTIDITNETAVSLTQELVAKYIAYFDGKGCTFFNMGADEYANTTYSSGAMGFGQLQTAGQYGYFVEYVNGISKLITDAGMIPVAFNDGLYFNNVTGSGTFDPNIVAAYWTGGWGSYKVASASKLTEKGHRILNTNDNWYYVLGRTTGDTYSLTTAQSGVKNKSVTTVCDGSAVTPVGSMMCLWCDTPSVNYSSYKSDALALISSLADNNPDYFVVKQTPEEPDVPEVEDVVQTSNNVSVTAPGLTGLTVQKITENVPTVEGAKTVVAYNVVPETAEGSYTGEATVSIPVLAEWTNVRGGVLASEAGEAKMGIEGDLKTDAQGNKTFTFTVPHFSTVVAYEVAPTAEGDPVDSVTSNGEAGPSYVLDNNGIDDGDTYVIVYNGKALAVNGTSGVKAVNVTENNDGTLTISSDVTVADLLWKRQNSSMYNENVSCYLNIQGYACSLTESSWNANVSFSDYDNGYQVYRDRNSTDYYLRYNSGWTGTNDSRNATRVNLYKYTASSAVYTVNPALQQSRITALTVANEGYTDESWAAYQSALTAANNKLTEIKGKTYNSEAAANTAKNELIAAVDALQTAKNALVKGTPITVNYVNKNGVTVKTETKTVAEDATSITLDSSIIGTDNEYYTVDNTTLKLVSGTAEYPVAVTLEEKAPDGAMTDSTLTVEQWITNIHAVTQQGGNTWTFTIKSNDASSDEGVDIASLAPDNAYWSEGMLYYWMSMRLDANNKQTTTAEDDETGSGTPFTHVRYHNGAWQYKDTSGKWNYFLEDDQAVAYYLQMIKVTDEVDTYFKDWGYNFENQDKEPHVALSVAVVYPDGTLSATEENIYLNSTVFFNFNNNWGGSGKNRDIGIIAPANNSKYEISKITVTPGVRTTGTDSQWSENDGITWEKETNEAGSEWYKETTYWDKVNDAGTAPVVSGVADDIRWPAANTAYLVLIYLDTVHYDTNLNVKWVDDSADGALINQMEVAVTYDEGEEPVTFFNGLKQASAVPTADGPLTLDDAAYVVNIDKKQQTFNKDITVMPNVETQYRSGLYQYVGAEIADDGMTLILHYNINSARLSPLYVVDFGLPVTFPFSDMVENPDDLTNVNIDECTYGVATVDMENEEITFTPNEVLRNIAVVKITVTYKNGAKNTFRMGFVPATTVYYEESFLTYGTGWTGGTTMPTKPQNTAVLGEDSNNYGYDAIYAADASGSNGTKAATSTNGATASFTFTGTGFALYANCNEGTGYVTLTREGQTKKMYMMDTGLNYKELGVQMPGTAVIPSDWFYNIPIITEKNLPHGTYTVTIRKTNNDNQNLEIDGFRVYETIDESKKTSQESFYYNDKEDKPAFYELRDVVLKSIGASGANSSQVYKDLGNDVYSNTEGEVGLITDPSVTYADSEVLNNLLNNGPKNEIYLFNQQTLTFKIKTNRVVQIGLKAPNGTTTYKFAGDTDNRAMNSSVDMFYTVLGKADNEGRGAQTISVTNTGKNILAITDLKVCDDPGFSFVPLNEADIAAILDETTEPEAPTYTMVELKGTDVLIDGTVFDYTGEAIEPAITVNVNGTQLVEGRDYSVTYTNNVQPGTATVTIRGIATASETLGYTGEVSIDYTINAPAEPEVPEETTKPTKPGKPEKQKDAKLKITFVNLMGKKVASATLTKTGTANQRCVFSADEITANAPARRYAVWFFPVIIPYGSTSSIVVPVF